MPSNVNTIQQLREATGAGVMECKRALEDAKGDLTKATELIRERGLVKAAKRADRATGAGLIHAYVHNERIGVLLDVRAETDFVVKSDLFRALAHDLVLHISAMAPATVDDLLKQPFVRDESKSVGVVIKEVTARVGENIRVHQFCRLEL